MKLLWNSRAASEIDMKIGTYEIAFHALDFLQGCRIRILRRQLVGRPRLFDRRLDRVLEAVIDRTLVTLDRSFRRDP